MPGGCPRQAAMAGHTSAQATCTGPSLSAQALDIGAAFRLQYLGQGRVRVRVRIRFRVRLMGVLTVTQAYIPLDCFLCPKLTDRD